MAITLRSGFPQPRTTDVSQRDMSGGQTPGHVHSGREAPRPARVRGGETGPPRPGRGGRRRRRLYAPVHTGAGGGPPSRAGARSRRDCRARPGTTRRRRARAPGRSRAPPARRRARRPPEPRGRRSTRPGGSARARARGQRATFTSPSSITTSNVSTTSARSNSFSPVRTSYCQPCQGHVTTQPESSPWPSGPWRWRHSLWVA
jgi:hypothetical protein